jgi:small subunit ribosomal protein S14
MAKKAWIERNKRKLLTVQKYAARRAELKAKRDYAALAKLPRDASRTRVVNRCALSGRRHGYLRKFGCSRLEFREMALSGLIPGVTKASW